MGIHDGLLLVLCVVIVVLLVRSIKNVSSSKMYILELRICALEREVEDLKKRLDNIK